MVCLGVEKRVSAFLHAFKGVCWDQRDTAWIIRCECTVYDVCGRNLYLVHSWGIMDRSLVVK